MFAAAMVFSAPMLELSIYSTCKRISQKLLRNIVKFLDLIYLELGITPYKVLRMNSEASLRAAHASQTLTRAHRRCTSRGRRGTATCASSTPTPPKSVSFFFGSGRP